MGNINLFVFLKYFSKKSLGIFTMTAFSYTITQKFVNLDKYCERILIQL